MQRVRREPPAFRRLAVASIARRSPYLVRLTLAGPELAGFEPPLPAGSVRLLMPDEQLRAIIRRLSPALVVDDDEIVGRIGELEGI